MHGFAGIILTASKEKLCYRQNRCTRAVFKALTTAAPCRRAYTHLMRQAEVRAILMQNRYRETMFYVVDRPGVAVQRVRGLLLWSNQ
jgi:hypothetical protein